MAKPKKEGLSSPQPRRRRKASRDVNMKALDEFGDSVLVQLMKASGRYDNLYRLYQQPVKKEPNTRVSNRSGVC